MRSLCLALCLLSLACTPASDSSGKDDTGGAGDDTGGASGPTATVLTTADAPVDATPTASADAALYLADGGDSLCYVAMEGGTPSCTDTLLSDGTAVVASADGMTAFVAAAEGGATGSAAAAIGYVASVLYCWAFGCAAPPALEVVPGTEAYHPVALARTGEGTAEELIFSGFHREDLDPGVFRVPAAGGEVEVLVSGLPAVPTGVAVAADGMVYAAGEDADGKGTVWAISEGSAQVLASGLSLGEPAGIELSPDDGALLVSSLSDEGTAQVLVIVLADGSTATWDEDIRANTGAGGLHRAANVATEYVWVDNDASGSVYRVRF